jgi:hypothetical protein
MERNLSSRLLYAAPEWEAGSLGWRSREVVGACPLEGLVRRDGAL